jgi:hypothetical protein
LYFFFFLCLGMFWFVELGSRGGLETSVVVLVGVMTALLVAYRPARRQAAGVAVGVALMLFLQAYALRHGPGMVCRPLMISGNVHCRDVSDPAPWVLGGMALVAGAVVVELVLRRRERRAGIKAGPGWRAGSEAGRDIA